MATPFARICPMCSKAFAATHPRAKYCSGKCRTRGYKAAQKAGAEVVELPLTPPDEPPKRAYSEQFLESVRRKLEEAGRIDEPFSLLALSLAEDAVDGRLAPAARRAYTAEFRVTFAEAMRGVVSNSRVDELRRRRDVLRAGSA